MKIVWHFRKLIQATPFKSDEPMAHQSFFIHLKHFCQFFILKMQGNGVHYDNKEAHIDYTNTHTHSKYT